MSPLDRLTHELSKLPGIGRKTALRLALHIIRQPAEYAQSLAESLKLAVQKIKFCNLCFHLTDTNPCFICQDQKRDHGVICVVEESSNLMAIERTSRYKGLYHVLHGSLSPLDGIGPDELKIQELINRLKNTAVKEIILATNPNVTGDATALYISKLTQPFNVHLTKLASGIPLGGDIEYVDQMTLSRAIESRVDF